MYLMKTPPPCEALLMPVLRLKTPGNQFIIKYDFGVYPEAWTVSVKLARGDVGTVVHVYDEGKALEVEFVALDGETLAVVTVESHQVRPVLHREITHARCVA